MALRGWRLFGVAGTILVYVGGILVLSFVSLQGPQQKRGVHGPRGYGEFETLRNRDLGLMGKKPPLQWCTELHYRDAPARVPRKPPKLLQTFPGHFVKKFSVYSYHQGKGGSGGSSSSSSGSNNGDLRKQHNQNLHSVPEPAGGAVPLVGSLASPVTSSSSQSVWPNNGDAPSGKLVDSDSVRSSEGQLRRSKPELAALVSFPGSGNTWLRYLLQQATGILTGSVYKDYGLLKSGFPAESVANSSVLVVKTHEWGPNAWAPYTKAILLVRDPERAILAEFNRQSGGHVGFASPDRYRRTKGRYWTQFVKNKLWAWEQTNLSWAKNFTGEVRLVFYDDLVANVEGTLRSILKFLNHTPDEELLACALMRKEGIYRRKKRILQFDPYSPAMHAAIDEKRAEVYAALGRYDAQ
ncbi:WSCD family member AGAP003962 [Anopheles ziemanni]|uniref:WSCD family member AGAP003962 n=1 Tax=Anopheles coustani TaxID=139045 RepID=UPI00265989AE|nr:WSCD family member AGAP003962 [Anopheles coustani]XP_058130605.1 WSCD family member AGAP003962 [Anopheles coustani]XP_058169332.1 WSCD family member AGAP003962 [Anopheles ziemanni]